MTNEKGRKNKGSGTPTDVYLNLRALRARRASTANKSTQFAQLICFDALAYRRSTTALAVRAFGPWAQLQARLPGTWQDVRSCTVAPTGEQRSCALTRALPAPACPSPGNAPPGPVVVPVSMMPEAARERSVSFRARAPHSLHLSEYLRDRRPWRARFFSYNRNGDDCQRKCDIAHAAVRGSISRKIVTRRITSACSNTPSTPLLSKSVKGAS
jgi:hypothetical protein